MRITKYKSAILFALIVLSAVFNTQAIHGQEKQVDKQLEQPDTSEATPEAPEKVDVLPVAEDDEIANRLNDILEATSWFSGADVEVQDGVVFLTGEANSEDHKTWASDLASKTQDVVAVVNRMSVTQKSIWDFSGALAELRSFRNSAIQALPLILFGIVILVVTWFLAKLASVIANKVFTKRIPNSLLRWVATRAVMLPILIFGVYLVLRIAGLTQLALTVLGGTGLIGLVIGIAFQDIAENFLASILISVQKPFRIGDLVRVEGHEGIVQRVTTRGTALLTSDGNHVQIPNSKMYKNTIENFTANPLRRVSFELGIGYDDSASDAQQIILETVKEHTATLNDPPPKVLIESLGASTVNLTTLFWIDGTKNDFQSVRSSCMRIAKQALLHEGISMPDEAREVIFPNGVPVLMNDDGGTGKDARTDGEASSDRNAELPSVKAKKPQAKEQANSEAEGNMRSDTDDLKKQAADSWLPGEGEEILVGEE